MEIDKDMVPFKLAKWIWKNEALEFDDYVSFVTEFKKRGQCLKLYLSADSVYAVYLNGVLIKTMQCSDYPHYKFYDEIELNNIKENNELQIDVWHINLETQNYYPNQAGLIFEIKNEDNEVVAFSSKKTSSRIMEEFKQGLGKYITSQLGLSFEYFPNLKNDNYTQSIEIENGITNFHKRDINNIDIFECGEAKIIRTSPSILVDLGKETVGYPVLRFNSPIDQEIVVAFGEYIFEGGVRRILFPRDFSFKIHAKSGLNVIENPLRRIGCRYLEVFFKEPISDYFFNVRPVVYHHEKYVRNFENELDQKIYDVCLYTLECCMHEHYEDCPWREQALYTLDSRNQMLCGYYAFKGFEYQKHNLLLMAQDEMKLGLLSLCYPMKSEKSAIPMFSLIYIIQVYEYVNYSKDFKLLNQVKSVIDQIVSFFKKRVDENGLIKFIEKPFWNFYEWTPGSHNDDVFDPNSPKQKDRYELIINAFYVYAVSLYNEMYQENINANKVKEAIFRTFYDEKTHLFKATTDSDLTTQFSNAMAVLIGLGDKTTINKIKNCENMVEASLSVRGFFMML